eukprot:scaffold17109_cov33-Tisochrysis_lutea.AAC.1
MATISPPHLALFRPLGECARAVRRAVAFPFGAFLACPVLRPHAAGVGRGRPRGALHAWRQRERKLCRRGKAGVDRARPQRCWRRVESAARARRVRGVRWESCLQRAGEDGSIWLLSPSPSLPLALSLAL